MWVIRFHSWEKEGMVPEGFFFKFILDIVVQRHAVSITFKRSKGRPWTNCDFSCAYMYLPNVVISNAQARVWVFNSLSTNVKWHWIIAQCLTKAIFKRTVQNKSIIKQTGNFNNILMVLCNWIVLPFMFNVKTNKLIRYITGSW